MTLQVETSITRELLDEYFSDNKIILLIMIGISVLVSLTSIFIQYRQNLKLNKKIESYKNELKLKEVKFTRFNELQIESLKILYDKMVTFHFQYFTLISPYNDFENYNEYLKCLKNIKAAYQISMEHCHRNKIFLPIRLIEKIKLVEKIYEPIDDQLHNEIFYINEIEYSDNKPYKRYKNLKSTPEIIGFENEIKNLRAEIEDYFKELTA